MIEKDRLSPEDRRHHIKERVPLAKKDCENAGRKKDGRIPEDGQ
jgi:hypothetical protein